MDVSLFASSVRPELYQGFFDSLESTSVEHEVIFSGCSKNIFGEDISTAHDYIADWSMWGLLNNFRYIQTSNIKPAQCYEIARRHCQGEVVVWVADDCEFPNDVIGKAYRYWKKIGFEKLILSIQTKETGYNVPKGQCFDMNVHRFFGGHKQTPLMAPLGMMSRKFLDEMGGIDRRYICGQYENDIVMRAYAQGGMVEIFGGPDCFIDIDHLGKSYLTGESKKDTDFLRRPFALGYSHDRSVLENSWVKNGIITFERSDKFEPFEDKDILTKSQSFNLPRWE